jgi:hypothetical protein
MQIPPRSSEYGKNRPCTGTLFAGPERVAEDRDLAHANRVGLNIVLSLFLAKMVQAGFNSG